jgi:hypothetical protein
MSEILGHDVNGRPLRAGDRVVYVGPTDTSHVAPRLAWCLGVPLRVIGPGEDWARELACEPVVMIEGGDSLHVTCADVRRLDDRTDHQPSDFTFDSLMDHLKSGVPA